MLNLVAKRVDELTDNWLAEQYLTADDKALLDKAPDLPFDDRCRQRLRNTIANLFASFSEEERRLRTLRASDTEDDEEDEESEEEEEEEDDDEDYGESNDHSSSSVEEKSNDESSVDSMDID